MKSQKTAIIVASMTLLVGMNAFSQDKKRERPSPEQMFEKLDANEDGKIVKDEIKNERMLKRFDKMDANSDGAITLDELKSAFEKGKKATNNKSKKSDKISPEKLFTKLDVNNDEKLEKDEIKDEKILKRFDKIDSNSDGAISLEELENAFKKRKK